LLGTACSGQPRGAVKALVSDDPVVRSDAAIRLGQARSKEAVDTLIAALNDQEEAVRVNVIRALGDIGDRSTLPMLYRSLDDPFYKVRCLAAHAIAKIAPGDAEAKAAVAKRLAAEDVAMAKVDLSWALGRLGERSGMETIRTLLFKGEPEDVRAEAAVALGELGDASELPLLEKALTDKMGLVRNRVAEAIDKIKGLKAA